MTDAAEGSVTAWLDGLRAGDERAAREVYDRIFSRVVNFAKRRISPGIGRSFDEEDAANEAIASLYRGIAAGRFEKLDDRHDLWRILSAILRRKVTGQLRRQRAQKRGNGNVLGESVFAEAAGFDVIADPGLAPEQFAMVEELSQVLFESLRDDVQRLVAKRRLEGYTTSDIARELCVTERTVERKLQLIRQVWSGYLQDDGS